MRLYRNSNTEPSLNLALEEWLLQEAVQDCFMLWSNKPSIIVGRNQNTIEEINKEFVENHDISVVRRLSGGGAVYHDLGNLNFTFISHGAEPRFDFLRFAQPILEVLKKLGVKAEYSGRNDMTIAGKKFSGNAQYVQGDKVLHHGTLLFQSDLSILQQALKVAPGKYESKGVKSVGARVTNILPYLPKSLTIKEFAELILAHIESTSAHTSIHDFTENDYAAARNLVASKYGNWEWNYGKSVPYNFRNELRLPHGTIECRMVVNHGIIGMTKIYGDFFGNKPVEDLEICLNGIRHNYEDIRRAIEELDIDQYFLGIDRETVIKILL